MQGRREFLKGTAWMGMAAMAAGCTAPGFGFGAGGTMQGFRMKPLKRIRIGFVGLGEVDDGRITASMPAIPRKTRCASSSARGGISSRTSR